MQRRSSAARPTWRRFFRDTGYGQVVCVMCRRHIAAARYTHNSAEYPGGPACQGTHPLGVYARQLAPNVVVFSCACCFDDTKRIAIEHGLSIHLAHSYAEARVDAVYARRTRNTSECTICFHEISLNKQTIILPCKHTFCLDDGCVRYLRTTGICPMCRGNTEFLAQIRS